MALLNFTGGLFSFLDLREYIPSKACLVGSRLKDMFHLFVESPYFCRSLFSSFADQLLL